jgi:uncharacterized membrane protein YedE/YeeE
MGRALVALGFGIFFGFALSRSGASNYNLIIGMLAGTDLKLAWVIITAIIVAFAGMRWLHLRGDRGYRGQAINVKKKPLTGLTPVGGIVFGIGWAMAGACPGTALVQVGEGKILALFTTAGVLAGTYIYAWLIENNRLSK